MTYSVLVVDMFKAPLKESKHTVGEFATLELAREYARRRTWGAVEEQRRRHVAGADEVKRRWFQFGKNCSVVDDPQHYEGLQDLAHFIEHPPKTTKRLVAGQEPERLDVEQERCGRASGPQPRNTRFWHRVVATIDFN